MSGHGVASNQTGQDNAPGPELSGRSMAIVLHPDQDYRDTYGVLTLPQFYQYEMLASMFKDGYDEAMLRIKVDNSDQYIHKIRLTYTDIRDMCWTICDMPYEWTCAIALHLTQNELRKNPDAFQWSPFHPVI